MCVVDSPGLAYDSPKPTSLRKIHVKGSITISKLCRWIYWRGLMSLVSPSELFGEKCLSGSTPQLSSCVLCILPCGLRAEDMIATEM